jgi:hypothetical protein|nr:MAG TPA: portal protein [Caudoviricetes sp.]
MNFIQRIFGTKEFRTATIEKEDKVLLSADSSLSEHTVLRLQEILRNIEMFARPRVVSANFMTLFGTVPEVFWPIDYIAKRISEAHYDLKRVKDDSVVWCNRLNVDRILSKPNPLMSWREVVYQHFVYKLVTGNAFLRAAMPDSMGADTLKCQWCSNYWELPADKVTVEPVTYSYGIPIFGIADKEELIKGYKLAVSPYTGLLIPHYQIWHDRDGLPECLNGYNYLKAKSRLLSVMKPIANLIAVYEARNVIYVKRGGLGFIVATKADETGTVALDPDEKKELRKEIDGNYGIGEGKSPYGVTDIPINFVRTNLSISELQPFDETLEDAIKIASIYGIPAVLVPRKDQSTFSNQDTAEKSVYTSTIIPAAKRFCEELTLFLGLEQKGYYLDCDFSDVSCLQTGRKEAETVKDMILKRGLMAFNAGLCTLDDIRAQLHEDRRADTIPLFGKLKFEMTPEELEKINTIVKNQSLTQPSKGEENEREDEKPSI